MSQLFKNTASQKLRVYAYADAGHATLDPGEPVTGDAANISARTAVDNGALGASNDVAPTEVDATNAPGYYEFDPTQAETNGDVLEWYAKSSTAGVQVMTVGGSVQTLQPPNLPDLGIGSDGDLLEVNALTNHTAQSGDNFARLGAPAGASVSADIAALPTQAEITGGAYALDTDANGRVRNVVGTGAGELSLTAGLIDGITGVKNTLDDLNDISTVEVDTALATYDAVVPADLPTNFGSLSIDINGRIDVSKWLGTAVTLSATTAKPQVDVDSVSDDGTAADNLEAAFDGTGYDLGGIDVSELNAIVDDWLNAGRLDTILDELTTQGDTNETAINALNDLSQADIRTAVGLAEANLDTQLAALPTQAEITGGAYALDTDPNGRVRIVDGTGAGELSLTSGLIAGIAGTKNTFDDLNDITVANILTTQMTESYAANGVAPTLAEINFAIHQLLMQFVISGTSLTVRKLDNSTTAFVGTLDDATSPTSLVRT